ncbi:MAG TPA: MarR family transcriptional regulator [Nonomuraea sp.]|nr:MarR family transcriptional regulator [Nonomuraea sp.]
MATTGAGEVEELSDALVVLTRASHAMRVQLAARSVDGVEWGAYALLVHVVTHGPSRSSALAEAACIDPSTVSRHVAALVAGGLVDRRPDPQDGRAALLVATDAGRELCEAARRRRVATVARIVQEWTPQDVATLAALIDRFNDSFARIRPQLLAELTDVRSERTA